MHKLTSFFETLGLFIQIFFIGKIKIKKDDWPGDELEEFKRLTYQAAEAMGVSVEIIEV